MQGIPQGAGTTTAGKITEKSGALAQYFYDGIEKIWKTEMFDFRYAVTEYVSDDHRQTDVRQCATILYELASGTRVPNSSIYELRRVPKAIQALLEQAFDGEFESASAFANAIAIHPAAAPTLPSARLIK